MYWDVLELFDEYIPLVLSIQRYHSSRQPLRTTTLYSLTIFPPLFYGFGGLDLLSDRLVEQQSAQLCIPVELMLVLCTMGQFHAMHAESQIGQCGELLTIASWPTLQHAEMSWQSAESFFRWASLYAFQVKDGIVSSDPVTRTIRTFFEETAAHTATLARMCSCHRLSTHITGLSLTEMRPERLSRIGSVCARRALTLIRDSNSSHSYLSENRFSQQIKWCLRAYELRWTAVYYQCELAIYRLDANPEIAIYLCDSLLKLRIPHLPLSQQQDSSFSQFAHDVQLKHHTQLTEALDMKKELLNDCSWRFGTTWSFQALGKCLAEELLAIRGMGSVFGDEKRDGDGELEDEESNYASPFLVEMIAVNIDEAFKREEADGSFDNLSAIKEAENASVVPQVSRWGIKPVEKGLLGKRTESPSKTTPNQKDAHPGKPVKLIESVKNRPASASQQNTGWVTMNYGGKLLHFESSVDSIHTNQSSADLDERSQTCLSNSADAVPRQLKPRPASSPCYLSSKRIAKPRDQNTSKQLDTTKMWAPTRATCALCERRFMRTSLPGVVVMKRINDLRRKWGVIQDSKKFNAPSALYSTANVCLLCQEILTFEESKKPSASSDSKPVNSQQCPDQLPQDSITSEDKSSDIARMIYDSIVYRWHQQPSTQAEDNNLQDIAVNKRVRQSSTVCSMKAQHALHPDSNRSAHTKDEFQPWWEIDLANYVEVHSVKVYLRDEVSHLYAAARGLAANPSRYTTGVYPLHITISMKTGVGRDCDDIVASCVSSLCVTEKKGPSIEWLTPHTSRGRFVRIQSEGRAILHIERVHVYAAKPPSIVPNDPVVRRQHFRQKLQRAAFCASVIATTASPVPRSSRVAVDAEPSTKRRMSTLSAGTARCRGSQLVKSNTVAGSQVASALFFDPERAEKRQISRLYTRFKSLLDARAKYVAPEAETDEEGNEETGNETQKMNEGG